MAQPSDLYTRMASTVQTFFDDYNRAPHEGASVLSNTLTPDCRRYMRPYTFTDPHGIPRDFYFDNAAYETGMVRELSATQAGKWTVLFASIDVQSLKASARSEYRVSLRGGAGEYLIEVSWFLDFSEDGRKIRNVVEVVEPITALEYSAKVGELAASAEIREAGV